MENKFYKNKNFLIIILVVLLLFGAYYIYALTTKTQPLVTETISNTSNLNNQIYEELSKPRDFGAPISTDESGYGRANPFAPYN